MRAIFPGGADDVRPPNAGPRRRPACGDGLIAVDEAVRPYALPAGEGWTYLFSPLGVDFVVKIGEQRHGRRLSVFELTTRAGEEPPVHTHATEDEIFYVLDGQATFTCGEERFEAAGGTCVFLPRGIPHSYRITGGGDARLLVITAPAPDDGVRGWGGFIGNVERDEPLRATPASPAAGSGPDPA
jgi:quercetin dioxygenase-like cupin family protein